MLALNDLDEQVTSHSQCDQLVMPDVEQLCNTHECVSPQQYDIDSISSNRAERTSHWRTGPWGAVSARFLSGVFFSLYYYAVLPADVAA